jgi:hypothetical protein
MRAPIVAAVALIATCTAGADYPTPDEAGFHHCALIYERDTRGPEDLAWYVANDRGWLFDAFLFLHQRAQSGAATMNGMTSQADWEGQLDTWFAPGRDLHALDDAIEAAKAAHGAVAPRQVILTIPYPHPKVTEFGDVDGDGISESLATDEGRQRVAQWYVAEAIRRFEEAELPNLQLWGLYWMNEGASDADVAVARQFSEAVHATGKRVLWIPWFMASNWQRWREMGVDVAIMQPNYAFLTTHGGSIRRNRLVVNARAAQREGLGVEIELPMGWRLPGGPMLFRHYLRDGAADRLGYQQAATAYYFGRDAVETLASSPVAAERAIYDDLCLYVQGGVVAEPDPEVTWTSGGSPAHWLSDHLQDEAQPLREAEARVPARPWGTLDVMLHERGAPWVGLVVVEGQAGPQAPWRPVGWALRARGDERDRPWQAVTVPLEGVWRRLRVRFEGDGRPPRVSELALQPWLFDGVSHLACDAPYQFSHPGEAQYGDSGGELTDGLIPETGFSSGGTVGWTGPPATITFDLEQPTTISHAEVHLQGGSVAGIHWPKSAIMFVSNDAPARRASGRGAAPQDLTWLGPGPVVVDLRRSERDHLGHLTFRTGQPVTGRFVSFIVEPVGHLMVTEIRIFSDGENVAAGRGYALETPPTPVRARESYPDDGRKLTDGQVTAFAPRMVVGWRDNEERTVTVDLHGLCALDEVLAWTMTGAPMGIVPLPSARVEISEDGEVWRELGEALVEDAPATPSTPCACRVDAAGVQARYVRVTVQREEGWAMLSEIEVRGERVE